jgi:hypothetical protein
MSKNMQISNTFSLTVEAYVLMRKEPELRFGQALITLISNTQPNAPEINPYESMNAYYMNSIYGTKNDFYHWEDTSAVLDQVFSTWFAILDEDKVKI